MSSPPPPPPAASVYSSYLLIIVATAILLIIAITLVLNSCRCILMESLLPSFTSRRSKKESKYAEMIPVCRYQEEQSFSTECSVCLIAFQEGEKVKQLPACRHSFHGPCVDMWLYSHSSCPLCRAVVPLAAKVENDKQQRVELREAAFVIASAV